LPGEAGRLVEPSWLASPSLSRHFGQSPLASAGISAPHSRQLVTEVVMAVLGLLPSPEESVAKGYTASLNALFFLAVFVSIFASWL
jgi:hypothetical protein